MCNGSLSHARLKRFYDLKVTMYPSRIALACLLVLCAISHDTLAATTLEPAPAEGFFITPSQPAELTWKTNLPEGTMISYALRDYADKPHADGIATVSQGLLHATVTLEQGYYDITVEDQTFGIVAMPVFPGEFDDYFGMDVVLTWLESKPDRRATIVKMLQRSGIGFARDRFRWIGVNPQPGKFDWNEFNHADDVRKLYAAHGIKVLEMFHDPGIARGTFPIACRLPQNLLPIPSNWPEIYKRWQSSWGGLEVWNEPDGGYGSDLPADAYVPLVHAMNWTFRQRDAQTMPMGGGVLTGYGPGTYEDFLARNGMFNSVDFVSFHDYRRATQLESVIVGYRRWLVEYGHPGMPLWLTECGYPWVKGGGRAPRDQDANSAWQIVAKGVIAKACGIAHYFPFCMPFYEEGGVKSFSMIGKDLTALRSMAAYAQQVRVMSHQQYVGDLPLRVGKGVTAMTFAGDAGPLLVVLTADTLDATPVALPIKPLRVEAVDGRSCEPMLQWSITDGIAYAWIDRAAGMSLLKTDTTAMQQQKMAKTSVKQAVKAYPIVMQHEPDIAQVNCSPARYIILPGQASAMKLTVKVSNLDTRAHHVTLKLQLPQTKEVMQQQVELAPQSMERVSWSFDASTCLNVVKTQAIVMTAEDANGSMAAPLALPFRLEGDLSTLLAHFPRITRLPISDVSRWRKNIAGHGTQHLQAVDFDQSHGVQMDVSFTKPGERWFYPKLVIEPKEVRQVRGVIARIKADQNATIRMIIFEKGGGGYWTSCPIVPADGQWHVAYIDFSEFQPLPSHADMDNGKLDIDQIAYLATGMHDLSPDKHNVLSISDLLLVRQ